MNLPFYKPLTPNFIEQGVTFGQTLLSTVFIFILVAAVLFLVKPEIFAQVVKDVTLRVAMNRMISDFKSFAISNNGRFPTCVEVVGVGKTCKNSLIKNISYCKCPYFTVKDVYTPAEPFEGFKYLAKDNASFCLIAPANNSKKGRFLRYKHGVDSGATQTDSTCD
ncbi:MAG: hypothetical protein AAB443_04535 [Patescibacteria group bacterium]